MLRIDECLCIDVETANNDWSSICQLGVARLGPNGVDVIFDELVNPESPFHEKNTSIHGLNAADVANAPTFSDIFAEFRRVVSGCVVFTWKPFDAQAIAAACNRIGANPPVCLWVDAHQLVYRNDPAISGRMSLEAVCQHYGVAARPHHAAWDAKSTLHLVEIVLREQSLFSVLANYCYRCEAEGFGVVADADENNDVFPSTYAAVVDVKGVIRMPERMDYSVFDSKKVKVDGEPAGTHFGEVVKITGDLSVGRQAFADEIAILGFSTHPSVIKKTTILIIGMDAEAGTIEKAEKYREKGQEILFVTEQEFRSRFMH